MSLLMKAPIIVKPTKPTIGELAGSTFAVTGGMALSNGNLTATGNTALSWGQAYVNRQVIGSVYVEITANAFGCSNTTVNSGVGISPVLTYRNSDPGADSSFFTFTSGVNVVFSISFNAVTGAYEIRRNGVLVKYGTVAVNSNNRIMFWSGLCNQAPGVGTLNVGATSFVYTPVYL